MCVSNCFNMREHPASIYQDALHCPLLNYHWLSEETENNIRPNSLGLQGS